jgi:hypothetical protein
VLTIEFVPYSEIENLNSDKRIDKLLDIVKQNKIVLMQGRLQPEEETLLISETMAQIKKSFKGVEICTIYPEEKNLQFFNKFKKEMVKFLIGHRDGVTIIGPSNIVKEIRRNPNKVELFTIPGASSLASRSRNIRKSAKRGNGKVKVRRRSR